MSIFHRTTLAPLLLAICPLIHGQTTKNTLEITMYQNGHSYTENTERNDYFYESSTPHKQTEYRLVHNADSSYVEQLEDILVDYYIHLFPIFKGGAPSQFCVWLGNNILELLPKHKQCSFRLHVSFVLTDRGRVADVRINPFQSNKEMSALDEQIISLIKESPVWQPEHHYWKRYFTPYTVIIEANGFAKRKGLILVNYSDHINDMGEKLFLDSPANARMQSIPEYQIAPDSIIDEKAHLEDESIDLQQWIKANVQDVTEMTGFEDGKSTVELIITDNGWINRINVIESCDPILENELASKLLESCPRWTPAKVEGVNVPSKVLVTYYWHFQQSDDMN